MALFGKSFHDIFEDIKRNKNGFSGFMSSIFGGLIYKNGISKNDARNIQAFIEQCKSGIPIGQAWNNTMKNASASAKRMAKDVKTGALSIDEVKKAANGSRIAMVGMQLATVALNTALSIGLSFAIQGIVELINLANKRAEEAAERLSKAADAAKELKESENSIDEYKSKINELKAALDSGNLSQTEAQDKRRELMSIQDELIQKYGSEQTAIQNVTDSIHRQTDAIDELKKKEAEGYLRSNQDTIAEAQRFLNNKEDFSIDTGIKVSSAYDLMKSYFGAWLSYAISTTDGLSYQDVFDSNELAQGNLKLKVNETRGKALEIYDKLYDAINKELDNTNLTNEDRDKFKVFLEKVSEAKSYIEKGRDNRNDYYNSVSTMNTAIESALMTTKGLDALYADYQKKIDAYNDAVIADDTSLIQETYSNLQNSYNNLLSNIKGDIGVISQDSIKNWIKDTQHKIDLVADDTPLILDIKASLDEEGTSEETVGGFVHIVSTNKNAVQEIAKVIKDNQYTYEDLSEVASIAAKNASDLDDTKRDIYKSMSDKQKEVYDALNTYVTDVWNSGAEEAGRTKISIDELINALLKLGVVERKTVQQFSKFSLSDYKEDLDSLNKDISTLQSAYTKSISGELTDEDKLKLITDKDNGFPALEKYINNIGDGIKNIANGKIDDVLVKLSHVDVRSLSSDELNSYNYLVNYLVDMKSGFDGVSESQKKYQSELSDTYSIMKSLTSMKEEISDKGALSQESVNSILGDAKYKELWDSIRSNNVEEYSKAIDQLLKKKTEYYNQTANNLLQGYLNNNIAALKDEITAFEKQYDVDLSNWESLSDDKKKALEKTNAELLSKTKKLINDFKTIYLTDLTNYSNVMDAKADILWNFRKSETFSNTLDALGSSVTYDAENGRVVIRSADSEDHKRINDARQYLNSIGWDVADFEAFLNGELPDIVNDKLTSLYKSNSNSIFNSIANTITNTVTNFDIDKYSGGKSSGSSTSNTKQFFDWIERRLKKLASDTKRVFSQVANYISFSGKNNQLSKAIGGLRSEIQANEEAYRTYMAYADSIDLDEYYKWQVRNGSMRIDRIEDSGLQEKIAKYKEYYDAAMACNDAVTDLKNTEKEYGLQMLSNIETYYNNRIKAAASDTDFYNSLDTKNRYIIKNYKAVGDSYNKQIKETEKSIINLRSTLNWLVSNGIVKEGGDEWYQWTANINQAELSVQNLRKSISDLVDEELKAIQTLYDNRISLSNDAVSLINANSSDSTRVKNKNYSGLRTNLDLQNRIESEEKNKLLQTLEAKTRLGATNGGIDKYSETWYQWMNTINKMDVDIVNRQKEKHELAVEEFNDIQTNFEHRLKTFDATAKAYENKNKELELTGKMANANYYKALQDNQKRNNRILEQESKDLAKKLNDAVKSGDIKEGSEAWYQMQDSIQGVNDKISEGNLKLLEYDKTLRQIKWDAFDYLQDKISLLANESDFLIDLMSNSKLFNEKGAMTKEGKTTAGLHIQNYDTYMRQADKYRNELLAINKALANDPNNTELIKRREELIKAQQQSISAAEKEKIAIKNLVKEGVELQLESLKKLIDQYTDSIDKAKDLYTYQKNINDKTSNIAKLQKQIAAYENDTSEETRTKIQKLQVDLKEAQEDLRETEYDKFISDTKDLLNDMYEDYEKTLNERLDNIDGLFGDMINTVNGSSGEIRTTIREVANDVGATLSQNIIDIWSSANSVNGKVVADYSSNFSGKLTTTNAVLTSIEKYVADLSDSKVKNGTTDSSRYMARNVKKYASGGLVNYTGLARVDGTYSKPEAFLNAEDTKNIYNLVAQLRSNGSFDIYSKTLTAIAAKNASELSSRVSNSKSDLLGRNINLENHFSIAIDHVDDYNDLVTKLQSDRKFENMIQDMTVNRLMGNNSLTKHKYTWQ